MAAASTAAGRVPRTPGVPVPLPPATSHRPHRSWALGAIGLPGRAVAGDRQDTGEWAGLPLSLCQTTMPQGGGGRGPSRPSRGQSLPPPGEGPVPLLASFLRVALRLGHPTPCSALAISTPLPAVPYVTSVHLGVAANVQIHTRPAPDLVFEGQGLVLTCSATGIPGPVSISWHKRLPRGVMRIQAPGKAEFRIAKVKDSDAGEYHCVARSGQLSFPSKPVTISVKGTCVTCHLRSNWVT